ncbi:unnamed protein product [Clonostachys rosea f. rosea IK726]|uniref:Mid2 domain-containing protein n=3 Tax=Bionectria ochroleuca TaxID=29856 RepID=A0A0B7JV46_BIOOC|nr:unnamed protein product [Clonostachys rosea f. rosea IK726]
MGAQAFAFHPRVADDKGADNTASEETLWPPPKATRTTSKPSDEIQPSGGVSSEKDPAIETEKSGTRLPMTIKTDSGKTITIPNNEVVTVTKHTLIITDKPPPLSTETSSTSFISPDSSSESFALTPSPTQSNATDSSLGNNDGPPLSTGGLVGIGVAGAAFIAVVIALTFMLKRRHKKTVENNDKVDYNAEYGRDDLLAEKYLPQRGSLQTTGTPGNEDPFAPFGGRVDRPESDYPIAPNSNTFEMDGTSIAPCELPDTSPSACKRDRPSDRLPIDIERANAPARAIDPSANLNQLGQEGGKPRYINHWNQYKAMSAE